MRSTPSRATRNVPSPSGPSITTLRSCPWTVTISSRFMDPRRHASTPCGATPCGATPRCHGRSLHAIRDHPVPARRLVDVLLERRILVCVGSGGVGKTTTAAALAVAAARRGKRTLVLTIDPARRLANSLGLASLGHQVQQVDPALIRRGAPSDRGQLWAMMLDQKQAFDEVVARHAKDPDTVRRILANPVYAQISSSLSGAQEYAAMAKLHDFDRSGEWELIVVDTPPTSHALDFLDAPRKLSEAIDSPAIEWFRKLQGGSGSRWSVVGKTGTYVIKRLAKFVGSKFIDDLGVFFTEFNDILGGFRQRAEETFALLRQPRVGFVLVASPEPMAVREALAFHRRLAEAAMPFVGFVVNKEIGRASCRERV